MKNLVLIIAFMFTTTTVFASEVHKNLSNDECNAIQSVIVDTTKGYEFFAYTDTARKHFRFTASVMIDADDILFTNLYVETSTNKIIGISGPMFGECHLYVGTVQDVIEYRNELDSQSQQQRDEGSRLLNKYGA